MKIVDRKTFLKLPSGTLFMQADSKFIWSDLHVKFDSLIHSEDGDGDFVSMPFTNIDIGEYGDSLEWYRRVEHMLENGVSYALSLDSAGRDGMFNRESIFMVYERSDVIALRDFFIKLVEQPE